MQTYRGFWSNPLADHVLNNVALTSYASKHYNPPHIAFIFTLHHLNLFTTLHHLTFY